MSRNNDSLMEKASEGMGLRTETLPAAWAEVLLEAVLGKTAVAALKTGALTGLAANSGQPEAPPSRNVFRLEGEYWTVTFEGRVARLKNSKGLHDIAYLLSHPAREIHAADLMGAHGTRDPCRGGPSTARVRPEQLAELGLSHVESWKEAVIDSRAREQYRSRIEDLQEELEEAEEANNLERASKAKAELDFLAAQLASAYGMGGQVRKTADPGERARRAVGQRIRRDLARIEKALPTLGNHLLQSIRTGVFCSYRPDRRVEWQF
jgi:hypothetical protein